MPENLEEGNWKTKIQKYSGTGSRTQGSSEFESESERCYRYTIPDGLVP